MIDPKLEKLWLEHALHQDDHPYAEAGKFELRIHGDTPSFMGAAIAYSPEDLKGTDAVICGFPWEGAVIGGPGSWANLGPKGYYPDEIESRRGTYDAPDYIRENSMQYALHQSGGFFPEVSPDFRLTDHIEIMDYRDVEIKEWDVEETATRAIAKIGDIVRAGAVPLVLGGDHSTPYPVVRAISDNTEGKTGIIWFDRHYDIEYAGKLPRPYGEASRLNSGTALYKILDTCKVDPSNVVIVGIGGGDFNNRHMHKFTQDAGMTVFTVSQVEDMGIEEITNRAMEIAGKDTKRTYVTLDADVMDPISFAAMRYPEPFGMSARDIRKSLAMITQNTNLAGFDLSCMAPAYDTFRKGGLTAVRLYIEILKGLAIKKMKK